MTITVKYLKISEGLWIPKEIQEIQKENVATLLDNLKLETEGYYILAMAPHKFNKIYGALKSGNLPAGDVGNLHLIENPVENSNYLDVIENFETQYAPILKDSGMSWYIAFEKTSE